MAECEYNARPWGAAACETLVAVILLGIGEYCFKYAYFVGFSLCCVSLIVSFFLIPRSKYGLALPEDGDIDLVRRPMRSFPSLALPLLSAWRRLTSCVGWCAP